MIRPNFVFRINGILPFVFQIYLSLFLMICWVKAHRTQTHSTQAQNSQYYYHGYYYYHPYPGWVCTNVPVDTLITNTNKKSEYPTLKTTEEQNTSTLPPKITLNKPSVQMKKLSDPLSYFLR